MAYDHRRDGVHHKPLGFELGDCLEDLVESQLDLCLATDEEVKHINLVPPYHRLEVDLKLLHVPDETLPGLREAGASPGLPKSRRPLVDELG
jgi:hypothetical protein